MEDITDMTQGQHTDADLTDGEVIAEDIPETTDAQSDDSPADALYTKAELDMLLQREGDRRVTAARQKWERESGEKIAEAARLSAEDTAMEKDRVIAELADKLRETENEMRRRECELECIRELEARGLPASLAPAVMCEDRGEMKRRLFVITGVIRAACEKEVHERLSGRTPTSGRKSSKKSGSIADMSVNRLQALYELGEFHE